MSGLTICDVGPRDGLQNEPETLDPSVRAELVNRLAAAGLDRVNFTLAATETFNRRNGNQTLAEAQAGADRVLERSELPVTLTISVAFGCPFEGRVDPGVVAAIAERFASRAEIVLADTIGVATPTSV